MALETLKREAKLDRSWNEDFAAVAGFSSPRAKKKSKVRTRRYKMSRHDLIGELKVCLPTDIMHTSPKDWEIIIEDIHLILDKADAEVDA